MSLDSTVIKSKAAKVTLIFNGLGLAVLILGGLGVVVGLIASIVTLFSDSGGFGQFLVALFATALYAVYVALIWASVNLATIIAGYISNRS